VVSFGVLHHIPEPLPVVRAIYAALRPGGRLFAWLYGREGNGAYLAVAQPLRALTKRLPDPMLDGVVRALDLPLAGLHRAMSPAAAAHGRLHARAPGQAAAGRAPADHLRSAQSGLCEVLPPDEVEALFWTAASRTSGCSIATATAGA
jgi:SAM-dependent methyltransferase